MISKDLTTTEAAHFSGVSATVVRKWIDSGILRGYRVPTGGGYRRVRAADLVALLREHGMPVSQRLLNRVNDG